MSRIEGPGAGKPKLPSLGNTYAVKAGDTLKSVASAHNVNVDALAKANSLSTNARLKAGQELTIPGLAIGHTIGKAFGKKKLAGDPAIAIQKVIEAARKLTPEQVKATERLSPEIATAISSLRGGTSGVHVNSGPPGFVNGGGHANFDPKTTLDVASRIDPSRVGSHVNSGPPGFVNGGGHANFDPKTTLDIASRIDPSRVGSHVNSGPPGFVNGGGHANFDPKTTLDVASRIDPSRAGSHVNSGPPGFVNGGGHANFDPKVNLFQQVTLPTGQSVRLPATGKVDITIGGFRITR
jgi:LysM repeat protein